MMGLMMVLGEKSGPQTGWRANKNHLASFSTYLSLFLERGVCVCVCVCVLEKLSLGDTAEPSLFGYHRCLGRRGQREDSRWEYCILSLLGPFMPVHHVYSFRYPYQSIWSSWKLVDPKSGVLASGVLEQP